MVKTFDEWRNDVTASMYGHTIFKMSKLSYHAKIWPICKDIPQVNLINQILISF